MPAKKTSDITRQIKATTSLTTVIEKSWLNWPIQKRLTVSFLTGMASAVGAVIALAIVMPVVLYVLQSFEWVPIVGDFAADVVDRIQQTRQP